MTDYCKIVFQVATKAFDTETYDLLNGHTRLSMRTGQNGCERIVKDPAGGFDIQGVKGQHFWVCEHNVIWAEKLESPFVPVAVVELPTLPEPQTTPEVVPEEAPVTFATRAELMESVTPVVEEMLKPEVQAEIQEQLDVNTLVAQEKELPIPKKKPGRPKKNAQ